jgi:hypothetical protein
MSLVGPRPERPFFVEQFKAEIPHYDDRHRVPGGLTGLAQVHGLRGDTSIEERARFDNHYIENWSLWRDLTILMQTLFAVVRNVGSAGTSSQVATTVTAGSTLGVVSTDSDGGVTVATATTTGTATGTAVGEVTPMPTQSGVGAVRSEDLEGDEAERATTTPVVHESNEAAPIV